MQEQKKGAVYLLLLIIITFFPAANFIINFLSFDIITALFSERTLRILFNTFIQSSISVFISLLAAVLPAVYISSRKNVISSLIEQTIFIPFFFPSVSAGIAFSLILRNTGLNYTIFAVVITHVFYNSPIIVKYLSDSLRTLDSSQIEAAEIDGAGRLIIFHKIIFPQIKDGLSKGIFLAFTYCFTSFAVILSVGNIKYSTFETAIASSLSGQIDFSRAVSYSIVQLAVLAVINHILPKTGEIEKNYTPVKTKKSAVLAVSAFFYFIFEFSIVIHTIIYSFINSQTNSFDLAPFYRIFSNAFNKDYPVIQSLLNSLLISVTVSLLTTGFAYKLLNYSHKLSSKVTGLIMALSSAFYAVTLYFMNITFNIPMIILLISGIFTITTPIAYSFMYDNFKNFDKSLIEAAECDGASRFKILRYIKFPLLKFTVIGTILQIFTITFGEFTLSFSMKIQSVIPLSSIVNYTIGSRRLLRESAAMSTINILIVLIVFNISSFFMKNRD